MENSDTKKLLMRLNAADKRIASLYHSLAQTFRFSDSALWILYTLRLVGKPITQSELCGMLFETKQTVNSSLKKLAESGFLELRNAENSKKNKRIFLTDKGAAAAKRYADGIISAEVNAMNAIAEEKRLAFIEAYEEYAEQLKTRFRLLMQENKE